MFANWAACCSIRWRQCRICACNARSRRKMRKDCRKPDFREPGSLTYMYICRISSSHIMVSLRFLHRSIGCGVNRSTDGILCSLRPVAVRIWTGVYAEYQHRLNALRVPSRSLMKSVDHHADHRPQAAHQCIPYARNHRLRERCSMVATASR